MDKAVGSFIAYQKEAEERYQKWEEEHWEKETELQGRKNERNGESMKLNCSRCWVIYLSQAILLPPYNFDYEY
jgi:hypothetical protein